MATISISQKSLFGGFYHNVIVLKDDYGNKLKELNGGPVRSDQTIINFNDPDFSITDYLGSRPLGVQRNGPEVFYYSPSQASVTVLSGSLASIQQAWSVAEGVAEQIRQTSTTYFATPFGPFANSNSVASSVLRALGVRIDDYGTGLLGQPGSRIDDLVPDNTINYIRSVNGLAPLTFSSYFTAGYLADGSYVQYRHDPNGYTTSEYYQRPGDYLKIENEYYTDGRVRVSTQSTNGTISTTLADPYGSIQSGGSIAPDHSSNFTIYDYLNQYSWKTQINYYDTQSKNTISSQTNDDASSSTTFFDRYNANPWTTYTNYTDANGYTLSQYGNNDNASHWQSAYDPYGVYNWAYYTSVSDVNYAILYQYGTYDTGAHWNNYYDPYGVYSYYTYTDYSNAAGALTSEYGTYDNAAHWNTSYDYASGFTWNQITNYSDAYGNIYSQSGLYDNGGKWASTYDWGNIASWSSYTFGQDAYGVILDQVGQYDNGTRWLNLYDPYNIHPWNFLTYTFNAVGTVIARSGTEDNGSRATPADLGLGGGVPLPPEIQNLAIGEGLGNLVNSVVNGIGNLFNWIFNLFGGYDGADPIVFDLSGRGVDLTLKAASTATFDLAGHLTKQHVSWAGPTSGFLVLDIGADGFSGPDGQIDQANELDLTRWSPGARNEIDALSDVFDTNHNGKLDAGDSRWSEFRIWQDANANGVVDAGELASLDGLGIVSLDLTALGGSYGLKDGSQVLGVNRYTLSDGTSRIAVDTQLSYEEGTTFTPDPTDLMSYIHIASDGNDFTITDGTGAILKSAGSLVPGATDLPPGAPPLHAPDNHNFTPLGVGLDTYSLTHLAHA